LILSILIGLPLLGAILVALFPAGRPTKALALLASLATFVLSLLLYTRFSLSDGGFQFKEQFNLVPSLGIHYSLGLDGISLWLVILATALTPLVILGSFTSVEKNIRGYYASLLLLESSVVGTLTATDLFLFYIFWELMLIPAFFLIGLWGGPNRVKATVKFVLFTMLGSLLMLVALLYVTHEVKSFDYDAIMTKIFVHPFQEDVQFWCFLAFALAFLIKVPLFPFHAWLPDAYTEAPAGGTVMLSSILVKLGAYGLLRFCIPFFPHAAQDFAPWIMGLAVAGIVHGALMASIQTDFKRLAAYSSLSHMGLIILGIFTFSLTGLQGGLLQMGSHGIYMAGLFLLIGMLHERRGSHEMDAYGGIAKTVPLLSFFFIWMMVAAVGLPGFSGFVGEILILTSSYKTAPVLALVAITGFVLSAWYLFNLYGKVFLGPLKKKEPPKMSDLSLREILVLLPLALLVLWIGLQPNFFLRPMDKSLQLNVIEKLKPPPTMTDFAAQERRHQVQQEAIKDKRNKR
jgi:NADH-quinone oxidoreductase subunit M